jgi:hypothetical protein
MRVSVFERYDICVIAGINNKSLSGIVAFITLAVL